MENPDGKCSMFKQNLKLQLYELKTSVIQQIVLEIPEATGKTLANILRIFEKFECSCIELFPDINQNGKPANGRGEMFAHNRIAETKEVFTQTEDYFCSNCDDFEEWFDAEDTSSDIYTSSDEVRDEYNKVLDVSCLNGEINKIVPFSDEKAWILADKRIYLLVDNELKIVVDEEDADDFVVFHDNSLLILKQTSSYILKRLVNSRIVKFASVQPYHPFRIGVDHQENVIILLKEIYTEQRYDYSLGGWYTKTGLTRFHTAVFNSGGILQSLLKNYDISAAVLGVAPGSIKVDVMYQWYQNYIYKTWYDKQYQTVFYNGTIGVCPSRTFKCSGFAIMKDDDVIVADINHHAILLLDKDLKFKNCLLDATDDLYAPGPIALYNNKLWVIDCNIIKIFELKENKE